MRDLETISLIWVENPGTVIGTIKNTKLLLIDIKPKDAIKLNIVK